VTDGTKLVTLQGTLTRVEWREPHVILRLETRQGNFDLALSLGAVLLAIAFAINVAMLLPGQNAPVEWHARHVELSFGPPA